MEQTRAAHDGYVGPRCRAMAGECEWPDDGEWPMDLFVELTEASRIVVMQRAFGTGLPDVEEDTLMSMGTEGRELEEIVVQMAPLLLEVSRVVLVAEPGDLARWATRFQQLALETNVEQGSIVTNVLAIGKGVVESAVRRASPDVPVHAFVDGECVELTGAEMSSAVEAGKPGYMLYALLLPEQRIIDVPFEAMTSEPQLEIDDIVSVKVATQVCAPCGPIAQ